MIFFIFHCISSRIIALSLSVAGPAGTTYKDCVCRAQKRKYAEAERRRGCHQCNPQCAATTIRACRVWGQQMEHQRLVIDLIIQWFVSLTCILTAIVNIDTIDQFTNFSIYLPFSDTIALFSSAAAVIGVHGGALANIVFSGEGTLLVELGYVWVVYIIFDLMRWKLPFQHRVTSVTNWHMSTQLSLAHHTPLRTCFCSTWPWVQSDPRQLRPARCGRQQHQALPRWRCMHEHILEHWLCDGGDGVMNWLSKYIFQIYVRQHVEFS